jgi:hypothetical protein
MSRLRVSVEFPPTPTLEVLVADVAPLVAEGSA